MPIRDKLIHVSKDTLKLGFQATLVDKAELKTLKDLKRCLEDLEQYAKETQCLPKGEASALAILEFDSVFDAATLTARWERLGPGVSRKAQSKPTRRVAAKPARVLRTKKRKVQKRASGKRDYVTGEERAKILNQVLKTIDGLGGEQIKGGDIKKKVRSDKVKKYIHRYLAQLLKRKWIKATGKTSDKRYTITAKGQKELG